MSAIPVSFMDNPELPPGEFATTKSVQSAYGAILKFWGEHGKRLDWFKPYTKVKNTSFNRQGVSIKWFEDGTLNVSYNCIDRHLATRGDQVAIIWEGDNPNETRRSPTRSCTTEVCRLANVMKARGVKKGDRVTIYMPMIPEAAYAMLACTRIGAMHSIVFGGFSPDALAGRIKTASPTFVITADEGVRGGKKVPLKHNADKAIEIAAPVWWSRRCWWSAHRRQDRVVRRPRHLVHEAAPRRSRIARRKDERRRSAVHPLHLRFDRQAQGRAAHHRRLSGLRVDDPQEYVFDYTTATSTGARPMSAG
jgi:hypothetical protein